MLTGLSRYEHLVPLCLRLGVGLTMFFAGYGKVTGNMANLVKAFAGWGIPMPEIMAPFVAYLELLGGIAVLLGLLTRLVGLLFVVNMAVAITAARWPEVVKGGGFNFGAMRVEVLLLLGSLALALAGAGPLSLDAAMLEKKRADLHRAG